MINNTLQKWNTIFVDLCSFVEPLPLFLYYGWAPVIHQSCQVTNTPLLPAIWFFDDILDAYSSLEFFFGYTLQPACTNHMSFWWGMDPSWDLCPLPQREFGYYQGIRENGYILHRKKSIKLQIEAYFSINWLSGSGSPN